jgi:deoxyribodipyrimidine photo-lyase
MEHRHSRRLPAGKGSGPRTQSFPCTAWAASHSGIVSFMGAGREFRRRIVAYSTGARGPARIAIMPTTIVWFRRDLRVDDNAALARAAARGPVVPLFVLDPRLIRGRAPRREAWLSANLAALDARLREAGAGLLVRRGDPRAEVPRAAREAGADRIHWSRDYTPFARRRDEAVERACRDAGLDVVTFAGDLLVEPAALRTRSGGFYRVFTPYYRAWAAVPAAAPDGEPPGLTTVASPRSLALPPIGGIASPEAGERAARAALERFVTRRLASYGDLRDRMDVEGTSRLSPYVRFGVLTPRQILAAVRGAERSDARLGAAAEAFARELAWREFFVQILWHVPGSLRADLREDRRGIAWRRDPEGLRAWREGRTGYPVVDAGMRELAATGFMGNRARLVTASFLTKHLLIDWREGERWFMRHLLDGDPAVNVGNWQWVASTGADAMPAFRIFNPGLQGMRFDPRGDYVRRWVPELAGVAGPEVHAPGRVSRVPGYLPPIVAHDEARARALGVLTGARRDSAASAPSDAAADRPDPRGSSRGSAGRGAGSG